MTHDSAFLSDDDWRWATDHLPIACVDIFPVIRDDSGRVARVGLILRDSPYGRVWCHLGGRVRRGELLQAAIRRHLDSALSTRSDFRLAESPFTVHEYFPEPRTGAGTDARKHAVASCFLAEFPEAVVPLVQGEAHEWTWHDIATVEQDLDLWPGTDGIYRKLREQPSWAADLAVYEAVNARHVSHNELMWQTPVLAMTAIAFLMTIALGDGSTWGRAVASLLSATVAGISVQLMARHSVHQIADADLLWAIERTRGMRTAHAPPPKVPTKQGRGLFWLARLGRLRRELLARLQQRKSRDWWINAMVLFGLTSVAIFVATLAGA